MKTVFVRPTGRGDVWYPAKKRPIKPEGEYVPARSSYWGRCAARGLLEIGEAAIVEEPKPEVKPDKSWSKAALQDYAMGLGLDPTGLRKAELLELIGCS